jgi:predicted nucleic acid-binding protein
MRTAVDSSVLLDVVTGDPAHVDASERALRRAAEEGALVVCECVLAEIAPAFGAGSTEMEEFLTDWELEFLPSTKRSALFAGEMFKAYLTRRRGPGPRRVVADFLIGAHALENADRLLARDRGYFRDYFSTLPVMRP